MYLGSAGGFMGNRCFRLAALFLVGVIASGVVRAQNGSTATTQNRFPYLFSNFPWWSDASLRAELKKRIPKLGDELMVDSQTESRVRTVLTELLRSKGIHAEVTTEEPSVNLLSAPRDPEAPPSSIVFSILAPPDIVVGKLVLEDPPDDAAGALNQIVPRLQSQPYSENSVWMYEKEIREHLQQIGYLGSAVTLKPEPPKQDGNRYLVPLRAVIVSGPKYHIADITADGGPLLHDRDLSPYFALKPGDIATPNPFGLRLIGALRTTYWRAGYPDVELSAPSILDSKHALASYHLKVIPGPLYHLRSLNVEGLSARQQTQALKMLGLKAGDIYNAYAVAMLDRKLSAPGSPLSDYGVSFWPKEDQQKHEIDLTLNFFRR